MPDTTSTSRRSGPTGLLVGGAVLTAAGGMLAAVGTGLVAAAALSAARRWQRATEMTPVQLARHAASATLAGAGAGAQAWRRPADDVSLTALLASAADGARRVPAQRPGGARNAPVSG
ncbi:hypothetical protein ACR9E3_08940 [Actinomycetospora sp. C-140]